MSVCVCVFGGTHRVMVTTIGNGHSNPSSNLGRGCFAFHSANTLVKGMNSAILPPAMGN